MQNTRTYNVILVLLLIYPVNTDGRMAVILFRSPLSAGGNGISNNDRHSEH